MSSPRDCITLDIFAAKISSSHSTVQYCTVHAYDVSTISLSPILGFIGDCYSAIDLSRGGLVSQRLCISYVTISLS
jgi:hypothetical protein